MSGFARLVAYLLLGSTMLFVGCRRESSVEPPHPERNIILISIDSLRADHVGCYGYRTPSGENTTPALDNFAQRASRFLHAYAASPWTLPSHVTMFTGLYADTHAVNTPKSVLGENTDPLAAILKRSGYRTGAIVCAPLMAKYFGLHQGFDDYDMDLIGITPRRASEVKVGPDVTRKALEWLDKQQDQPFFLFLHYWDVHYDYNPPDEYVTLFDPDYQGQMDGMNIAERQDVVPGIPQRDLQHLVALYDAEIRYTDDALAQLLAGLAQRGLDRNTAIIITSDHGDEFLDHGGIGHTRTCYEELVRIPLLVSVPWLTAQPLTIDEPVGLVDLLQTILELLDIGYANPALQGQSLVSLLLDGRPFEKQRFLYAETLQGEFTDDPKLFRWSTMITPKQFKLHRWLRSNKRADWVLFDLQANPAETEPVGEKKPVILRKLQEAMKKELEDHRKLKEEIQAGAERELDPELEKNLRGLGYLQ